MKYLIKYCTEFMFLEIILCITVSSTTYTSLIFFNFPLVFYISLLFANFFVYMFKILNPFNKFHQKDPYLGN